MIYTSEILLPVIAQAESYFARLHNENLSKLEKGIKPKNLDIIEKLWLYKEALTYCNELELYDSIYTTYIYKKVLDLISGHQISLVLNDGTISAPVLDYYLLGNAEPTPLASSSVYGKVRLSVPAANPSFPIALGQNDPLLTNWNSAYNDTILSAALNSTGQTVLTQRDGGTVTTPQSAILNQNSIYQIAKFKIQSKDNIILRTSDTGDENSLKIQNYIENSYIDLLKIGSVDSDVYPVGYIAVLNYNGDIRFELRGDTGLKYFTDSDNESYPGHIVTWNAITKAIQVNSTSALYTDGIKSLSDLDYAALIHNHDDLYYTESEIEDFFSANIVISGYNKSNWDLAYTNRITSLTTTGSSGAATLSSNTLNIPTYTLAGLGGQPLSTNLTSLSGLSYAATSFVKMTAAGTFALDTNTYATSSSISGTTGRLAKFTASGAVGDSIVSESGGVISVAGPVSIISGVPYLEFIDSSTGAKHYVEGDDSGVSIFADAENIVSDSKIQFKVDGNTTRMSLSATELITFGATDTGEAHIFGGSARVNGNVGIGVSPINAKLEVVATTGEVFRADAAGGAYRIIAYQSGVLLGGNVGIGTASPAYKLDVNGTLGVTGAATFSSSVTVGGSLLVNNNAITQDGTRPIITLQQSGVNKLLLGISSGTSDIITGDVAGDVDFRTNAQAFNFSVDNGASIAFKLASTGAATFSNTLSVTNGLSWGTSGNKYMYGTGGTQKFAYTISQHNIVYSGGTTGFSIYDSADTYYILRATDAGNVSVKANLNTDSGTIYAKASGTESSNYQLNAVTIGYDAVNGWGWITAGGGAGRTELYLNRGGGHVYTGSHLTSGGIITSNSLSGFVLDAGSGMLVSLNYTGGALLDRASGTSFFIAESGSPQLTIASGGEVTFAKRITSLGASLLTNNTRPFIAGATTSGSNYSTFLTTSGNALAYLGDADGSAAGGGTINDFAIVTPSGEFWNVAGTSYKVFTNGSERLTINTSGNASFTGSITALSIIKSGGTSAQFLKADGSLDSNSYLTANQSITLSGEASGTGTTSISVTLTNSSVINKVLTGLSITGSAITASDSILSAFGKLQNQLNGLSGGLVYKGSWNANTNTPTLADGVGTTGWLYIVNVAGTQNLGSGSITFSIGDWVIYNGTIWEKVSNTNTVTSVNGYTGAVTLTTNDITENTNLYFTNARAISSTLTGYTSGAGTVAATDTVLQAIQKLNGNFAAATITIGSTSVSLNSTVTTITGLTSITSTTFVGALTGNASTASTLQTGRNINGTLFNGSADITITAAAGTLTGTTLNSTVVNSSLTSLGTITTGVWQGTAIADSYISSSSNWNTAFTQTRQWDGGSTGLVAATGRASLGLVIGTHIQAYDSDLQAISSATLTGDGLLRRTSGTWSIDTATYNNYVDADARLAISETITGIDYNNTTGVFSLTTGYVIPTTTEQTNWTSAYNNMITSTSFNTSTGDLTLTHQDGGTITIGLDGRYITGNQTITLSGDISGSGTTAITTTIGVGKVTNTMLAGSITAAKLVGTDITTVGTITSGTWNGTAIGDAYISSASSWNSKIAGSGTTGNIPKFIDASTIGNSLLSESGDTISLTKVADYVAFDLNNTSDFSTNFSLRSVKDDGSEAGGSFQVYDVTLDRIKFNITPYGTGLESSGSYVYFSDQFISVYTNDTLATLDSIYIYGVNTYLQGTTSVRHNINNSTMLLTTNLGNTLYGATVLEGSGANSLKLTNSLTSSNGTYTLLTRNSATGIVENIFPTSLRRTAVNDTSYSMVATDELIAFSLITNNRTVTLLSPGSFNGSSTRVRKVVIKDEWGGAQKYPIAITVSGGSNINGVNGTNTIYLNTAFGSVELYTTGTYWFTTNVM